ncbi:flagellar biosynthesis protein FlgN [Bradyrhizobium diazoefficiens]|nr:flagellar biosynthesis protein FlgN [Bradyrhizobium diazoefficiens]MBR0850609.1 flagellar biosynthesis protein FlgN [Bradyrhizobium diazoefficiens]
MQANEAITAAAIDQPNMMTGATMDAAPERALLPALLPVLDSEAVPDDGDTRSEELRGLLAAIVRLETIVEEETAALTSGNRVDFDEFSARKSRGMLEFVRLMRARMHLGNEVEVTTQVQRLRQKLERNRAVLEMHYDAVREVAAIIVKAVRDAESDGTYSGRAARDGK